MDRKLMLFNVLQFWLYSGFFVRECRIEVDEGFYDKSVFKFEIYASVPAFDEDDYVRLENLLEKYGFKVKALSLRNIEADENNKSYIMVEIEGEVEK